MSFFFFLLAYFFKSFNFIYVFYLEKAKGNKSSYLYNIIIHICDNLTCFLPMNKISNLILLFYTDLFLTVSMKT